MTYKHLLSPDMWRSDFSLHTILNEQETRPGEHISTCHLQSRHFGKVLVGFFLWGGALCTSLVHFIHTLANFLYIGFSFFCLSGTTLAQYTACTKSLFWALLSGTNVHKEHGVDFSNLRMFLLSPIW